MSASQQPWVYKYWVSSEKFLSIKLPPQPTRTLLFAGLTVDEDKLEATQYSTSFSKPYDCLANPLHKPRVRYSRTHGALPRLVLVAQGLRARRQIPACMPDGVAGDSLRRGAQANAAGGRGAVQKRTTWTFVDSASAVEFSWKHICPTG